MCTFCYIEALAATGRRDESRAIFDAMLECRNKAGLLSEGIEPTTGELWIGIINGAIRLSRAWEEVI